MASITCPNCQTVLDAGTANCPSCGSPQSGVAPAAAAGARWTAAHPGSCRVAQTSSQVRSGIGQPRGSTRRDRHVRPLHLDLFLPWYSFKLRRHRRHGDLGRPEGSRLPLHHAVPVAGRDRSSCRLRRSGVWKVPATSPWNVTSSPDPPRDQLRPRPDRLRVQARGLFGFSGVGWSFGSVRGAWRLRSWPCSRWGGR